MTYHTSYAFAAPPDLVHGVVNDLALLARWLGEGMPRKQAPDVTRYHIEPGCSPFEVCWTPVPEPSGWPGRAIVRALPLGGSTIDIRLGVPVAFRSRIHHIDGIVAHVLRRIDEEAERRRLVRCP
jgi:hypothetical protein